MGKILQIRVSAWTYREEDVIGTWPYLSRRAWPQPNGLHEKRGVLELVTALENGIAFEEWPVEAAAALKDGIAQVATIKKQLEDALADWKPVEANKYSEHLEDALTTLEEQASKFPQD